MMELSQMYVMHVFATCQIEQVDQDALVDQHHHQQQQHRTTPRSCRKDDGHRKQQEVVALDLL